MSQDALFDISRGDWEVATRMKFDVVIPVRSDDLGNYVDEPICYWPVRNKRFPGVEFMLHASLQYLDEVVLAEKTTGATIAYGTNSDDLFSAASERLASVTPEKMAQSIEKGMQQRRDKARGR